VRYARTGGEVVAALATAGFLGLDLSGITINGESAPWQVLALISFLVFVALVSAHIWVLNEELHADERSVDMRFVPPEEGETINVNGRPMNWLVLRDTRRNNVLSVNARGVVQARNTSHRDLRVSDLYLGVYKQFWFFCRRCIARVKVSVWEGGKPDHVEWVLIADSPQYTRACLFQEFVEAKGLKYRGYVRLEGTIGKGKVTSEFHHVDVTE
jgi:hypothetical protein